MKSREKILLELDELLLKKNRQTISLEELHNILRRQNIIEAWRRKDYVAWLLALKRIKLLADDRVKLL